jgi:hypothetical protein
MPLTPLRRVTHPRGKQRGLERPGGDGREVRVAELADGVGTERGEEWRMN